MPGQHCRFLEQLSRKANIRSYAMEHAAKSPIREAYNAAILTLSGFRDSHIRLVSRYIILASKKAAAAAAAASRPEKIPVNLATRSSSPRPDHADEFHGTGGTNLIPFLKQTRDTTMAASRDSTQ